MNGYRQEGIGWMDMTVHAGRRWSTGSVTLRSADPRAGPRILVNYLRTEADRREMREAIRQARSIVAQKAFEPYRGRELAPGEDARSDRELDAFARREGESAFHPSCTCRMGEDDRAVVDGGGAVRGVEALRVVDASIMPRIINANLNGAVIMMAEKLADRFLGGTPLDSEPTPYYVAERDRPTEVRDGVVSADEPTVLRETSELARRSSSAPPTTS